MKKFLLLSLALTTLTSIGTSHALSTYEKRDKQILWPEGKIPYFVVNSEGNLAVSNQTEAQMRGVVDVAIHAWNQVGADGNRFNFFPISSSDAAQYSSYLKIKLRTPSTITECGANVAIITPSPVGESFVGYPGGFPGEGKYTRLELPSACMNAVGHELGHVLGFDHEHQRLDSNIVINPCNHEKAADGATGEACWNFSTKGWASSLNANPLHYLSDYDPLSVMHYGLQNNLKASLRGQINPETGVYFTTLDFTRDASKANNVNALASRLNLSVTDLYAQMNNRPSLLSALDGAAAKRIYNRDVSDLHIGMVRTCFNKDGATNVDICPAVGQFKAVATVKNFGAWSAKNTQVRFTFNQNIAPDSFNALGNPACNADGGSAIVCTLGDIAANRAAEVSITGILIDTKIASTITVSGTSTTTQNADLLDQNQATSSIVAGGSFGFGAILSAIAFALFRRNNIRL